MKESEIRNIDILNEYLRLVAADVGNFFAFTGFTDITCPSCASGDLNPEFRKLGFQYVSCRNCSTLFVNPRPPFSALKKFYSDSPSAAFWVNRFFKPMAEARREKIFRPRAEYSSGMIDEGKRITVGDIGAGFGLFLEELRRLRPENDYIAIEPSPEMAGICREKGFTVKCDCIEDVDDMDGKFDMLTAFELLEHLYDPGDFLKKTRSLLKPGGQILLTTLNGKGFDVLLLWEASKSVMPPHHLNFFNTVSIRHLLEEAGFEIVEIVTPGRIDWDIVEGMMRNGEFKADRFLNFMAYNCGDICKKEFQDWIAKNMMSSHMRVLARRI